MSYSRLIYIFIFAIFFSQANASRITDGNPTKQDWACTVGQDGQWDCRKSPKPKNVFAKELKASQKQKALANDLGWVSKPSYMVGGYYNNDTQFTKALCKSKATKISNESSQYDSDGNLIASGNVEFFQCNQEIYAKNAIVGFNSNLSSVESIEAIGNVVVRKPRTGLVIRTKDLSANLNDDTYSAGPTYFRFARETSGTRMYNKENFSGYIRGYGKSFLKKKNNILISDGYITTGSPYDNDWRLTGRNIDIDTKTNMAYIKNGYFEIKDIPVLYIPYYSHPIDDKRRSGFLMPSILQNTNVGYGISIPYYFNLAPNYDLLLDTVLWSKRGLMENGTFRYMSENTQEQFEGSIVPYDFQAQEMRGAFTLTSKSAFKNGISTNFEYDYVSDAQYYNDFSVGNIDLVTKTLLDREFDLDYKNSYINSGITILDYGKVNPTLTVDNTPYAKLPEVRFNVTSQGYTPNYLTVSANTLNTFFQKSPGPISGDPGAALGTNVNAFRGYESPKIAGNYTNSWSYIKPSLEVPIRYYQLERKPTDTIKFNNSSVTSIIPIFNIDAGAYFDRDVTTSVGSFTQTLHPRLFYTYIPYQDQTDIPLFDTSLQNEQYQQMFQVNRFTGHDRINNANQVTYALETSMLDKSDGSALAKAKIGQMLYLADRRVTLCQGNSKCPDPGMMDEFSKDTFSPVMTSFDMYITKDLYFNGQINYRINRNNLDYQVYSLIYKDKSENVISVSYNNIANDWNSLTQQQIDDGVAPPHQETITLGGVLNLTNHWAVAGLWNYNFQQKQIANAFVGVQYNAKSWALRFLYQVSAYTNQDPNEPTLLGGLTDTFLMSFELKGLGGGLGNTDELYSRLQQIPGYTQGQWGSD
ncbi:LPS-assembly protein LptD [Francisella sp. SYW-9]|uniref:LPS-assembly protein LptD n=1 Tax=Francisella sp. SYW-9 TaxID=2610888 RepID=UPI00123D4D8A|nr:LPS-assembly protein LptD [Francisella sp. SYW-9]